MTIDIARHAVVSISDAAVRRIITTTMVHAPQIFSPPSNGRGSERGWGVRRMGAGRVSTSVAFIGPTRMRKLNRTYHGEDRTTDVLAFPAHSVISSGAERSREISRRSIRDFSTRSWLGRNDEEFGELVLCPAYVRQQAKRAGESFHRELTRVLVHGTLHLLGHDHATPPDAERMFALQEAIVKAVSSK